MKKILYTVLATVSGLVLLFSYRTSLEAVAPTDASAETAAGGSAATTDTGTSAQGTTSASTTPDVGTTAGSGLTDGTYAGTPAQTRYGPVQVQITVSGGQITDAKALDYPDSNGRDREINGRAIPTLVSETIQAQGSSIDMVSGATYTSDGYLTSLQSAIDQAQS